MVVDRDEDDGVLIQKEAQAEKRLVEEEEGGGREMREEGASLR